MSYERNSPGFLESLTPVVKNLLIINVIFFVATLVLRHSMNIDLTEILGLHYINAHNFAPYQIITHMFMHDPTDFTHILFNMLALWMFGTVLEKVWGPKKFLIYYIVTGIGAAVFQELTTYIQIHYTELSMMANQIAEVKNNGYQALQNSQNFVDPLMAKLNLFYNTTTIGASGAGFGILLAFGYLFPNAEMMLIFLPIPIKAKYFVVGFGVLEFFYGITGINSNIAHFAHLGGMVFGLFLIIYWKHKAKNHQNKYYQ
jgi:membrane associated rhomboid family serine protease